MSCSATLGEHVTIKSLHLRTSAHTPSASPLAPHGLTCGRAHRGGCAVFVCATDRRTVVGRAAAHHVCVQGICTSGEAAVVHRDLAARHSSASLARICRFRDMVSLVSWRVGGPLSLSSTYCSGHGRQRTGSAAPLAAVTPEGHSRKSCLLGTRERVWPVRQQAWGRPAPTCCPFLFQGRRCAMLLPRVTPLGCWETTLWPPWRSHCSRASRQ